MSGAMARWGSRIAAWKRAMNYDRLLDGLEAATWVPGVIRRRARRIRARRILRAWLLYYIDVPLFTDFESSPEHTLWDR